MVNIRALRLRRGAWFVFPVVVLLVLGAPWLRGRVMVPTDILGTIDTTRVVQPMANPLLSDVVTQFYPWQKFLFDRLHAGEWPLWNPYQLAGTPFVANDQSATFDPVRLLAYVLGFSAGQAMWFVAAVRLLLLGLFMRLWLRGRGVEPGVATVAGVVAMTASSSIAWVAYPLLAAVLWLPLMLYAIEQLATRPRRAWVTLALAVAAQSVSGNVQISLFSLLVVAAWTLVVAPTGWRRRAMLVLTSCALGLALAAPQLLPTASFIKQSTQFETGRRGYATTSFWQAIKDRAWIGWHSVGQFREDVSTLVPMMVPNAFGNPAHGAYRFVGNDLTNNANELAGSIGILGVLLAAVGAWVFRRERAVRALTWGSLIGVGIIAHAPIIELVNYLPLVKQTSTGRLRLVIVFALIALAVYGWRAWRDHLLSRRTWIVLASLYWAMTVGLLWVGPTSPWRIVDVGLVTITLGGFLTTLLTPTRSWMKSIALAALVVGPSIVTMWGYNGSAPSASLSMPAPMLVTLQSAVGQDYRLAAYTDGRSAPVVPNTAMVEGLYDIRGYEVVRLKNFDVLGADIFSEQKSSLRSIAGYSPLLDMLAVKVVLVPADQTDIIESDFVAHGWTKSMLSDRVAMFINPHARARASMTDAVSAVDAKQPVSATLDAVRQYPSTTYITTTNLLPSAPSSAASAHIIQQTANTVTISTTAVSPRYLVLADSYDSGWRATIDGVSADIVLTNGWSRAVAVPSGAHTVRFTYRPVSFTIGLWVAGLAVAIMALVFAWWLAVSAGWTRLTKR